MESSKLHTETLCLNSREEIARLIAEVLSNHSLHSPTAQTARQLLTDNPITILNICLNKYDLDQQPHCCEEESFLPVVLLQPGALESLKQSDNTAHQHTEETQEIVNLHTATISHGPLSVDKIQRRAWCYGVECQLTPKEFELLWWFVSHPQRAVTRRELVISVWGVNFDGYEHTVSNHINRLRKKLSEVSNGIVLIETVWGVGYRLNKEENTAEL